MKTMMILVPGIGALLLALSTQSGELEAYPEVAATPPLALEDLGGHPRVLDDYLGQVVLVNFWASWCPPCLAEMPTIQHLKQRMGNSPFSILAVNYKESKATAWRFRKLLKVDFSVLLDKHGKAAEDWDVQIYPTSYLIDRTGHIRYVAYGAMTWDGEPAVTAINSLLQEHTDTHNLAATDSTATLIPLFE